MRIAILADVHANLEALKSALAEVDRRGFDRLVFLGDLVGYGADPAACVDLVRARIAAGALALRGNHDDALGDPHPDMNPEALAALRFTEKALSAEAIDFLKALPLTHAVDDALLVHASAHRPGDWPYVVEPRDAELSLGATTARVVVSGHTHMPRVFALQPNGVCAVHVPRTGVAVPLIAHRRWHVVVGSVGQPRDGDPAAACAILDLSQRAITQFRVPYDVGAAAAKIMAAGLPHRLARRLTVGR